MTFNVFIVFNGNCRQAVEFYSKVFNSEVQQMMTFGQMPANPGAPLSDKDKDKIIFCSIQIGSNNVMFCDTPSWMGEAKGNNISPFIGSKDKDEIQRLFDALKQGGHVDMPLQETFWSDLYGSVTDQFGIKWQFSHDSGKVFNQK